MKIIYLGLLFLIAFESQAQTYANYEECKSAADKKWEDCDKGCDHANDEHRCAYLCEQAHIKDLSACRIKFPATNLQPASTTQTLNAPSAP